MHEFAFIFRPTRALDPQALAGRNDAARDWAIARRREGTLQTASPLEDEGMKVKQDGVTRLADSHAVRAVLVIQAKDLSAAVALAQSHPGLAYGAEIEVRPVKAIGPLPPR